MKLKHEDFRTIWLSPADPDVVQVIDQRLLPHEYRVLDLCSWSDGCEAIADMAVRGAPLIGATAAWSLWLAARQGGIDEVRVAAAALIASRPTAVNLRWAVDRVLAVAAPLAGDRGLAAAIRRDA
jgi:methylthioribose-1-phosphate isomerase